MPKFRKKPVIIDAEQFTSDVALGCLCDSKPGPFGLPVYGQFNRSARTLMSAYIYIETLEGRMRADIGDWIIKGTNGEFYPCKPDIFASCYEAV